MNHRVLATSLKTRIMNQSETSSKVLPSAKNQRPTAVFSPTFLLLSVVFCVALVASNLLETKVLQAGPLILTGGLLVFPVSYIINDCVTEVWGYRKARFLIWLGFSMNLFVAILGGIAVMLPSPDYWEGEPHFNYIFSFAPRIMFASLVAFLVGSFLNALVMSKMKKRDAEPQEANTAVLRSRPSRLSFSLRAILSTLVGETFDSVIFFPIAFGGVLPFNDLLKVMLTQVILKTLYEIIALPLTIRIVRYVKRHESTDVYDNGISYNPLKIFDL